MQEYNAPAQDPNSPAYESDSYKRQMAQLQIVRDFRKGTAHIRGEGSEQPAKIYLIQFPAEETEAFNRRRAASLIFNDTETTLQSLVGKVFSVPPQFDEDVPEKIRGTEAAEGKERVEGWAENIDLQGTHWQVFAKDIANDAIGDGHAFIYVDMPPALPAGATLEDEQKAGRRPYWVKYKKDQAINWVVETVNGRPRLAQITLREVTCERDGAYGEKQVTRYRVLRPGSWELYKETEEDDKKIVTRESGGVTSLTEIPLVPIYGGRQTGFLESFPALEPLAQIECSRYNLYSDYRTGVHMVLPFIVRKSDLTPKPKVLAVGHHTLFDVEKEGDVSYMSVDGAGLIYFENDLKALDQRMAVFGLQLESAPTVEKTATEIVTTDQKADAPLTNSAQSLKDGLEMALLYTAQYAKLSSGGSVTLDYLKRKRLMLSPQAVTALDQAASNGHLDTQSFLEILNEAGWMKEGSDVTEIMKRLDDAADKAAERQRQAFNEGLIPQNGENLAA